MYEMRLYILNITKPYSEDEDGYTGEWFDCPVDFEEVKEKLGVKEVEEIEIVGNQWYLPPDTGNRGYTCGKGITGDCL